MTFREALAYYYPLHYQRIVECMHGYIGNFKNSVLDSVNDGNNYLSSSFVWADTTEGHEYWAALARAENNI